MQGAFLDSEAVNKSSSNLSADELLNTDKTFQDKAQSGVVTDKVKGHQVDLQHQDILLACYCVSLHTY